MNKNLNRYIFFIFSLVVCEKFCFYSIRCMVVLYITRHLHLSEIEAYRIVFSMMALSYITAVLGGIIGDYILGHYKSCVLGIIFFLIGDASLLLPNNIGFLFGLALISLSEGILRTNITSLLVEYTKSKKLEENIIDSIFTAYYSFINLGIALGILLGSVVGEIFGWNLTFVCSGIVGLCASSILYLGQRHLNLNLTIPELQFNYACLIKRQHLYVVITVIPLFVFYVMLSSIALQILLIFTTALSLYMFFKSINQTPFKKYFELVWSFIVLIPFFAFYEQGTSSVILLIDNFKENGQNVNFGSVPTSIFQSIDPILSMLLGYLISHFWGKNKFILSKLKRIILSFTMLFFAFYVLQFITSSTESFISHTHIIIVYILFVFAEVIMTPLGLSIISNSTFVKRIGIVTGLYNIFIATGQWSAGILAMLLFYDRSNLGVYHNGYYFLLNFTSIIVILVIAVNLLIIKFKLRNKQYEKLE